MKTTKQNLQEILVISARAIVTADGYHRGMNRDQRLARTKEIADTAKDTYEIRFPDHDLRTQDDRNQATEWIGGYIEALANQSENPRAYADARLEAYVAGATSKENQDTTERATEIEKARAEYEKAKEQERKASHEADNREAELRIAQSAMRRAEQELQEAINASNTAMEKAGEAHEETQKKGQAYRNAYN